MLRHVGPSPTTRPDPGVSTAPEARAAAAARRRLVVSAVDRMKGGALTVTRGS